MQAYLNKEFYENIKNDMKKYNSDYQVISERSRMLEQSAQRQITEAEQSYKILEKFGAIL